jgi:hypothetical protein
MPTQTLPRRWKTETEFTPGEERDYRRARRGFHPMPMFATDAWRDHVETQRARIAARRAEAENDLRAAEAELGIAVVDGTTANGARERVETARSELQALDVAEAEIARRDEEDAEQHRQALLRAERVATYRQMADYFAKAETVVQARTALAAADAQLAAVGQSTLLANARMALLLPEDVGIDPALAGVMGGELDPGETVERCVKLREKAERLAALEEVSAAARAGLGSPSASDARSGGSPDQQADEA